MKELIISLILFGLLLVGVSLNAVFVQRCAEYLNDYSQRLQDDADKAALLEALETDWQKSKTVLEWTVAHRELEGIDELMLSLRVSHERGNEADFARYCELLSIAADGICRAERFSFIFFSYETKSRASTEI